MMPRIVGVTDLQRRFRAVFDAVAQEGVSYVLTRGSRPEVVMIPYSEFQRFQSLEESEVLTRFDRMRDRMRARNTDFTDDEVAADVAEARRSTGSCEPS